MRTFIAVALLFGLAVAVPLSSRPSTQWHELEVRNYSFADYVVEFGRTYSGKEHEFRETIFNANLEKIKAINRDPTMTWKANVNHMTDRTVEEVKSLRGYNRHLAFSNALPMAEMPTALAADLPENVDWRQKNVVTPVKDQASCGSCWAFSAAETVESHIAIQTGKLLTLSEQEYVSCVQNPQECGGTGGCSGATQWLAFNYTLQNGITTEADYSYTASDSRCDQTKVKKSVASIANYVRLPTNDYNALMNAIATAGPIAISVAADSFMFYSSGVYNGKCGWTIDHAVVAVGYGVDPTHGPYWLVRNSWGTGWGEKGYIRIAREADASKVQCGTDTSPSSGSGCKGGPSSITVCGLCGILSDSSYPTGGKLI